MDILGIKKTLSNDNGFTLIELMIGLAIFSIGLLSLFAAITLTMRNNTSGHILTQASMLAQRYMEMEKARNQLRAINVPILITNVDQAGNPGTPGAIFNVNIIPTDPLSAGSSSNSRLITITVTVMAGIQQGRSVQISSIVTGNGI